MRRRLFAILVSTTTACLAGGCATSFEASTPDGAVKASNAFGYGL